MLEVDFMKFEAKFKAEKNKLYTLDGTPVAAEGCRIITARPGVALDLNDGEFAGLCVNWNDAGRDEDSYNEEFLAGLRDQLKELEERHIFVFIIPMADSNEPGSAEEDAFIASFKHCARRIKDCECVAGFAVPECVDAACFISELSAKHGHYIFFSKSDALLADGGIVRY